MFERTHMAPTPKLPEGPRSFLGMLRHRTADREKTRPVACKKKDTVANVGSEQVLAFIVSLS